MFPTRVHREYKKLEHRKKNKFIAQAWGRKVFVVQKTVAFHFCTKNNCVSRCKQCNHIEEWKSRWWNNLLQHSHAKLCIVASCYPWECCWLPDGCWESIDSCKKGKKITVTELHMTLQHCVIVEDLLATGAKDSPINFIVNNDFCEENWEEWLYQQCAHMWEASCP